jgi:putative aldouronate transport system substrate-binding protein
MKKVISLILVLVLALSITSCGTTKKADSNPTSGPKETVTLSLVMKDVSPSNQDSVKYFQTLEKGLAKAGINVKFNLVEMPSGNYKEKLGLLLTGGTIPDLIYFQGGDQTFADQGLLENLTPYIEKSKYIKANLQPYNVERLKNYPYLLWLKPVSSAVPVVRKDWFDKMKTSKALLENPSVDNYYAFFKELKNTPPGGAGKPSYAITAAGSISELDTIFNGAFGNSTTWIKGSDGKYSYSKISQGEKDKLAFYNKLYKEKLLDNEYLTKQWDTMEKAFYEGQTGVMSGTCGKVIDLYDSKSKKANGDSATIVVLPPANGTAQVYNPTDVTKESRGVAISAQSKNKEVAFQVLDYLASPEGQMFDRLGYENEQYKVVDGKIELTDKAQDWYALFWELADFKPTMPLKSSLLGEAATDSLTKATKYYVQDINLIIPSEYAAKWDAMNNLYKEYSADIITGKKPVSDFDKFVQEWNKAGGEEITKYANEKLK